jgi:hypothetical protein
VYGGVQRLAGRGSVIGVVREVERAADGLYLVAHDPASGRPRLGPRVLGLGLAAALLGELAMGGFVEVSGTALRATDQQPFLRRVRHHSLGLTVVGWCSESYRRVAPDRASEPCPWCGISGVEVFPDRLAWNTRELIAREPTPRSVIDWLTVLARNAPRGVAERLEADGRLTSEYRRSLLRTRAVRSWFPVNVVEADSPRQALRRIAQGLNQQQPGAHQKLLIALVDALQLTRIVIADLPHPAGAAHVLVHTADELDDPLRYLVSQAKAAADNAVIAHPG